MRRGCNDGAVTELPAGVHAMAARGGQWPAWVDALPTIAQRHIEDWGLTRDGPAMRGSHSMVLPVRTTAGTAAVLKISFPEPRSEHEHLALRRWDGDGAVRLLSANPRSRVLLLERAHPDDLATLPDVQACQVVAQLYRRIHVPALPKLPTLASFVERRTGELGALPRNAPLPRRLVEQAIALGTDLVADPVSTGSVGGIGIVVHGDLHYAKVLAAQREPWLVIGPQPLNGDPHYELAPMLWNRWGELDDVRDGIRRRFHTLVETAGLAESRARAWVIVRAVHSAMRELTTCGNPDRARLTAYVAVAKAVQD